MFDQFLRFLVVGGLAATTYLVALVATLETMGVFAEEAPAIAVKLAVHLGGLALAACVAYLGLRRWAFASTRPHRIALPRFVLLAAGSLVTSEALFRALLRLLPISYQAALVTILVALTLVVFLLARRWVFGTR